MILNPAVQEKLHRRDRLFATGLFHQAEGSWTNIIIESIFGVDASIYKGISASPQFGEFDPKAELINLSYQGKLYKVNKNGLGEV